ncbi:MAG TPA: YdaS family helix-turn-helix protein [Burkholderiales bacterium]|nr:YdaS family helix-turn-helix protein [Burkholderiales bacterium]
MNKPISPKEALLRAVEICGSQSELARRIGGTCKPQNVSYWVKHGLAPEAAIPIEKAVDMAVTRYELAPKIYPVENVA